MIVDTPLKELQVAIEANPEATEVKTKNLLAILILKEDEKNLQERRELGKIHITQGNFECLGKKYEIFLRAN